MVCHIETSHQTDGRWVTTVPALPGLQIYEYSHEDSLATARKLTAILLLEGGRQEQSDHRILVFYPGRIPDSAMAQI
jgi:hypothetical protein